MSEGGIIYCRALQYQRTILYRLRNAWGWYVTFRSSYSEEKVFWKRENILRFEHLTTIATGFMKNLVLTSRVASKASANSCGFEFCHFNRIISCWCGSTIMEEKTFFQDIIDEFVAGDEQNISLSVFLDWISCTTPNGMFRNVCCGLHGSIWRILYRGKCNGNN